MAAFRGNAQGEIQQLLGTYTQEKNNPWNQGTHPYQQTFDEATNAGVIAAYNSHPEQFRIDGGTVTQNDVAVTFNPPSLFYQAFTDRAALLAKANAEDAHTWTSEEVDKLVGLAFRLAGLD